MHIFLSYLPGEHKDELNPPGNPVPKNAKSLISLGFAGWFIGAKVLRRFETRAALVHAKPFLTQRRKDAMVLPLSGVILALKET
jgi:hypothetical protein